MVFDRWCSIPIHLHNGAPLGSGQEFMFSLVSHRKESWWQYSVSERALSAVSPGWHAGWYGLVGTGQPSTLLHHSVDVQLSSGERKRGRKRERDKVARKRAKERESIRAREKVRVTLSHPGVSLLMVSSHPSLPLSPSLLGRRAVKSWPGQTIQPRMKDRMGKNEGMRKNEDRKDLRGEVGDRVRFLWRADGCVCYRNFLNHQNIYFCPK